MSTVSVEYISPSMICAISLGTSRAIVLTLGTVRVVVLSPGVIETEVLNAVLDPKTLASYKKNKVKMGGGIGPEHVANLMLHAYQMPQNALVQEIVITPTRQKY